MTSRKKVSTKVSRRERKKAQTRKSIQEHALRLFLEQGYETTTVEQIADAVDISNATVYHYFRTKEEIVLYNPLDPLLLDAFRNQSRNLKPIRALRAAIHSILGSVEPEEASVTRVRNELICTVPALRSAMVNICLEGNRAFAEELASRMGLPQNHPRALALAGAICGMCGTVVLSGSCAGSAEFLRTMDERLADLEAGFA